MSEPMSYARIVHISTCLSVPCDKDVAEAFAHELLAEVKNLREERDQLAQVAEQRGAFPAKLSAQLDDIGETREDWGVRTPSAIWPALDERFAEALVAMHHAEGQNARKQRRLVGEWRDAE